MIQFLFSLFLDAAKRLDVVYLFCFLKPATQLHFRRRLKKTTQISDCVNPQFRRVFKFPSFLISRSIHRGTAPVGANAISNTTAPLGANRINVKKSCQPYILDDKRQASLSWSGTTFVTSIQDLSAAPAPPSHQIQQFRAHRQWCRCDSGY